MSIRTYRTEACFAPRINGASHVKCSGANERCPPISSAAETVQGFAKCNRRSNATENSLQAQMQNQANLKSRRRGAAAGSSDRARAEEEELLQVSLRLCKEQKEEELLQGKFATVQKQRKRNYCKVSLKPCKW